MEVSGNEFNTEPQRARRTQSGDMRERHGLFMVKYVEWTIQEDALMEPEIIDRGRGPEIKGTRITVYDIMDYEGDHHTEVAALLNLSSEQVLAARKYIEEHKVELMPQYQKMLARDARGNPPEVEARIAQARAAYEAKMDKVGSQSN